MLGRRRAVRSWRRGAVAGMGRRRLAVRRGRRRRSSVLAWRRMTVSLGRRRGVTTVRRMAGRRARRVSLRGVLTLRRWVVPLLGRVWTLLVLRRVGLAVAPLRRVLLAVGLI